jgi:hypothetical protein
MGQQATVYITYFCLKKKENEEEEKEAYWNRHAHSTTCFP